MSLEIQNSVNLVEKFTERVDYVEERISGQEHKVEKCYTNMYILVQKGESFVTQ